MRVLILGGGAVGACIAHQLAVRGADTVVIERHGVAGAASGKSGGFLALDWCDGSALAPLARRSFALHAAWADAIAGEWGYRRMTAYAGTVAAGGRSSRRGPAWVGPEVAIERQLGTARTAAQVDPAAFTAATMRAAQAAGATLHKGEATGLVRHGDRVTGVQLGGETLAGDAVVIAMGPWSALAARWLPLPPVGGLKGHSLVFRPAEPLPAEALFLEYAAPAEAMISPEVFPRADGTVYVCGISSEAPVPLDPGRVSPDPGASERLQALCARLAPALAGSPIVARGACFRPVTADGLPLIGPVPGAPGAFVATGHSVWGILNAPATGEAVAELIIDGVATLDLAPFDPARLPAMAPEHIVVSRRAG